MHNVQVTDSSLGTLAQSATLFVAGNFLYTITHTTRSYLHVSRHGRKKTKAKSENASPRSSFCSFFQLDLLIPASSSLRFSTSPKIPITALRSPALSSLPSSKSRSDLTAKRRALSSNLPLTLVMSVAAVVVAAANELPTYLASLFSSLSTSQTRRTSVLAR